MNSARATHTEIVKTMENLRRENVNQIEQVQVRLRQENGDLNGQSVQRMTDKLERLRDEFEYRAKDSEKVRCGRFASSKTPSIGMITAALHIIRTEPSARARATATTHANVPGRSRAATRRAQSSHTRRTIKDHC